MKRNQFSKDNVYRRMLKSAAELWDVHESELDSLDPMAKLLLGATAKEIERIGNEVYSSDARIFNRLSQFLLPDELQNATPAHGVVRLNPSENTEITKYDELLYNKKWKDKSNLNKTETIDICYSSAGEFTANDSRLAYRAQGNQLFEVDGVRMEFAADTFMNASSHEVYLGFRKSNKPSQDFRLYFDWLGQVEKKRLLNHIPKVLALNTKHTALKISSGLKDELRSFHLKESVEILSKLEQKVINYYNSHFLRLEWDFLEEEDIPPTLIGALGEANENKPESIAWIKLLFPPDYTAEEVKEVVILDNCVPCLNRKLEKTIFRLNRDLNIRKLDFDNFFLEIERAESSHGERYHECPSLDLSSMDLGSFSLRLGGTGRLDERDGYEYLNYLLDLLRDEKQSFAALDVTSTIGDLSTIEQILQKVKKRVSDAVKGSRQPYAIVKPHTPSENAHIYFWSTDGDQANNIPINAGLRCKNTGLSKERQVRFVSKSLGGRNEKDSKQMVQTFRSALLSRGMVVTRRDIVELCKAIGGNKIDEVEIADGIMTSHQPGVGLQATIDVLVRFAASLRDNAQREHLRNEMESELLARSNFAKPLRLLIKDKSGKVEKMA